MKKQILLLSFLVGLGLEVSAQISNGGIPASFETKIAYNTVPSQQYANPDWNTFLKSETDKTDFTKPYIVGINTDADFSFPASGQFIDLDNGTKIWRGQISVPGAPAIGLLYDKFNLPKGVKLFLSNNNKKQILGAYNTDNNDASGTFVTEPVQGNVVNVELNIDANVNINDIALHINKATVYHRAIQHLQAFTDNMQPWDQIDDQLNGNSSVCMINAICPQGENYSANRLATVQLISPIPGTQYISLCSGTLVNNTGNTAANCTPYLLTATHCDGAGSTSSSDFNQTLVRFNFERSTCTGGPEAETTNTVAGLNFVARADYNENVSVNQIKGDFMLFKFRTNIPASWGATLSGWNRNPNIATTNAEPKKFIGFHHPDGDNKKLSYSHQIFSDAVGAPNTHWTTLLEGSYGSTGSSGSGLFDGDGYLIGQLSVGGASQNMPVSCMLNAAGDTTGAGDVVSYSKFSYVWDYAIDGNAPNRKLSPWLDPANTGVMVLGPLKSDCTAIGSVSVNDVNNDLNNAIALYPNPNTDGKVYVKFNLRNAQDVNIQVLDVTGKTTFQSKISNAQNDTKLIPLNNLSNGVYIVKFATAEGFATKKVIINK